MKNLMQNKFIVFLCFLIILLVTWEMVSVARIWPPWVFPTPYGVYESFVTQLHQGILIPAILTSMGRLLIGFLISLSLGTILGILLSYYAILRRTVGIALLGLQTMPSICWLPLAILWFGLNDKAIIFVIIMGTFMSIAMNTVSAIELIPSSIIKAGVMLDARGAKLYRHIIFPAMLPSYLMGIKQGWSFAWRSLITGEMLFVTTGLGQMLMFGRELNDIAQVFATMGIILLLGVIVDNVIFGRIMHEIQVRWGLFVPNKANCQSLVRDASRLYNNAVAVCTDATDRTI